MTVTETSSKDVMAVAGYHIGDYDRRPWGFWFTTDVNPGYCEKIIVVMPGQILSLQSHEHRHEKWTVLDGILCALVDDICVSLSCGQNIEVPIGAVHAMANLGDVPCIVKERQTGICRENDIIRYLDAYGRETHEAYDQVIKSVDLYLETIERMKRKEKHYA